jgi:hypothetical protein
MPLRLWGPNAARLDLRNHRKIVIVDGASAFFGSQNIVSAHANKGMVNEEMLARATGPIVRHLHSVLLGDRYLECGNLPPESSDLTPVPLSTETAGLAQVVPSGPGYNEGTALAVMVDAGRAGVANPGGHGFAEILYAFSSAGNNNGSAFAGLSANTPFYNTVLGVVMLLSRYWLAVPVLALAGAFAAAKHVPPSAGTLPTHTPLLLGTVLTVGALTFVPALALGPVVEHLLLHGVR